MSELETSSEPGLPESPAGSAVEVVDHDAVAPASSRRLAPYLAGAMAIVLVAFVIVLARGRGGLAERQVTPLLNRPAPALVGTTIDGKPFDLTTRKGSWVLINFFQTTCTPCRQEHPELLAFSQRGGKAEVVTVVWSDKASSVQKFFAEQGGTWPVVLDPTSEVSVTYGVAKVPETFIVDRDGVVREHITGATTASRLDSILATLGA